MSNNASTIFDKLVEIIPTIFTDKQRVYDPYNLERNSNYNLRNGWGLTIRSGSLGTIDHMCSTTVSQTFGVVLTKEVVALENETINFDLRVKELMEEDKQLRQNLLSSNQLNIASSVGLISYSGNDGINFINNNKRNFISMESTFEIDIQEEL